MQLEEGDEGGVLCLDAGGAAATNAIVGSRLSVDLHIGTCVFPHDVLCVVLIVSESVSLY